MYIDVMLAIFVKIKLEICPRMYLKDPLEVY